MEATAHYLSMKNHFPVAESSFLGDFPTNWGYIRPIEVVSEFCFWHRKSKKSSVPDFFHSKYSLN